MSFEFQFQDVCIILFFICLRMPKKKTQNVKICVGKRQEGTPLDDGHCWRKYDQKDIHGFENPRFLFSLFGHCQNFGSFPSVLSRQ